jgi:Fe-S-cluster-containing hydrogenase component 2
VRNLKFKTNAVKQLKERITFLKRVGWGLEEKEIVKELRLYVSHVLLKLDKDACCECEICSKVCPKEAIRIGDGKEVTDDCVLCGFCAPFCPVGAIQFYIDGKEKNILAEQGGIPELPEFSDVNGYRVRKFFTGQIRVKRGKCPESCEDCVPPCPTAAIARDAQSVHIEEDKCLLCGACRAVCPENMIVLKRNRIVHSGGFSTSWARALEKLTAYAKVVLELHDRSTERLVKLIKESELKKWLG